MQGCALYYSKLKERGFASITQDKILNQIIDALSKYYDVRINKDELEIGDKKRLIKLCIPVQQTIETFQYGDFNNIFQDFLLMIENSLTTSDVNYSHVYPLIKTSKSIEHANVLSEPLFSNDLGLKDDMGLCIIYAEDLEHSYRYLTRDQKMNFEVVKRSAFENINNILPILKQIDIEIPIFAIDLLSKEQSDLVASLFLNRALQKQIRSMVGSQYLFSIPFSNLLLVAAYDEKSRIYVQMMKAMVFDFIHEPHKLSDCVYLSQGGNVKLYERMDLFE